MILTCCTTSYVAMAHTYIVCVCVSTYIHTYIQSETETVLHIPKLSLKPLVPRAH